MSLFAVFVGQSYIGNSARLLVLGTLVEVGRRLCFWLMERVRFQYSMTARFDQGDPAYEWIVHFITQEKVWTRSREFRVTSKSSKREWSIENGPENMRKGNADYVPTYELPQLFRWKGYWLEIKRSNGPNVFFSDGFWLSVYSLNMAVLSDLVEEARQSYIAVSRPNVIIHSIDYLMPHSYPPSRSGLWTDVKRKPRRPVESIVLRDGVLDSLLQDAREFIHSEEWYNKAGIPHRIGFLLYGPPGTGKSSTIYALAGEMGFEIYSLSLASQSVDDSFLQRAASAVPKHSIFLIEDIDCAFPSREDEEKALAMGQFIPPGYQPPRRSLVTMSGLLNVIDGVGSEEGKLFFATTNYIDRLDAALLRPGRIDRKVEYRLATQDQAEALYRRFYPENRLPEFDIDEEKLALEELVQQFAKAIPADEFSTAELQGYLLGHKKAPRAAVEEVCHWIEVQRKEREDKAERERRRRGRMEEEMRKRQGMMPQGMVLPAIPYGNEYGVY
ncbi:P-loop containing nucleoside triphosphate hydrolase protein [Hymenopellis radicata]|nr:P-loop containing nucleoside triphosphate hydrolase protein [Hymenopellis radicata]